MDELTLLRSARDFPAVPLDDLAKNRVALDKAIGGAASRKSAKRRMQRRAGWTFASVGVAAAIAITLVATDTIGFGGSPVGASAEAAEVLKKAAQTTILTADPIVGADQYLRVDTKAVSGVGTTISGHDIWYLALSTSSLFVPKSDQKSWVLQRSLPAVFQTFGPESQAYASKYQAEIVAEHGTSGEYFQAMNGAFMNSRPDYTPESLKALPRDPQQLLDHFYLVNPGAGVSKDGAAFDLIVVVLRTGFVPADLRAALYKAAALVPGVTVTEKAATLDGRKGISIGRTERKTAERQDIIIDPTNGLVIGERLVILNGQPGIPAGTALGSTSVTTSVVNSAPTSTPSK